MKPASRAVCLALALAVPVGQACASDEPGLNQSFQDHIAYVATFAMPVLIEKCAALEPGFLQKSVPLYFRYVSSRQDQIERGRLPTLAELEPGESLQAYRQGVLASRLGKLDSGSREEKLAMCEGALALLSSVRLPGQWPPRESAGDKPR
ncbi:MAG: hypothetical protein EOP91_01600 [Lysobacteraceae bacterium]|nr:MAG: hypothetical protein EOP91_01600 [Xanthomonadaceae bacterium]